MSAAISTRIRIEGRLDTLRPVRGSASRVVVAGEGGIVALEGEERRTLLPPDAKCTLFDAEGERLAVFESDRFRVLEGSGLVERLAAEPDGKGYKRNAWLFEDGLLCASSERTGFEDTFKLTWCQPTGTPKLRATCLSSGGSVRDFVLARGGTEVAWYELQKKDNQWEHSIVRWSPKVDDAQSMRIDRTVTALAFDGTTLYAQAGRSTDAHLHRMTAEGELQRVTKDHLPFPSQHLAAGGGRAFFSTSSSTDGTTRYPGQLFALDLATGERSVLSTGTTGELHSISVANGRVWWLESLTTGMILAGIGGDASVSAVCSLPL